MTDVTITDLNSLTPADNTYVPISNGTTTGKALTNSIGVPRGTIVMWSNYLGDAIPAGWQLCDGTNSTPDLRNRFIVGSGSSYAVGNTGGSKDAVVVAHSHSISDPGHVHSVPRDSRTPGSIDTGGAGSESGGSNSTQYNFNTLSNTTGITVDSAGSSGTNANLPPYYALAFIIKTI